MIIDSHQHFWQVGSFDYPWMSPDLGVLYQDHLPSMLEPVLQQNGVSSTVLVQASNSIEESRWLLSLADQNPFIGGVVGWVDLTNPEVDVELAELTAHPKFKGVRHLVESEPAEDWLVTPDVLRGLNRLAAHQVSYDLLVHTRHLKYVPQLVDSCPALSLVVDHMAKPPIKIGETREWASALKGVAVHKHIHCKLSGLVTEANWENWKTDDLRPYVETALELFGPERLMFGSDHPVCLLAGSYNRVLDSFEELTSELTSAERERVFFGNAKRFYRLNLALS
jgi:L-fuconolactonase